MEIVKLYKNIGETPLECLKRYTDASGWTYLGRLDPMAEGLLLVAKDIKDQERSKILSLPKTYEFEVLYGVATDTADILGVVSDCVLKTEYQDGVPLPKIEDFLGEYEQTYPAYSSRRVSGQALFSLARADSLPTVMPTKKVCIKSLMHTGRRKINSKEILENISSRILLVKGDFRQSDILSAWREKLLNGEYTVDSFKVSATSGLYVRDLAGRIGECVGLPALAYHIKRISVGEYLV